jgi:hypothetical protein
MDAVAVGDTRRAGGRIRRRGPVPPGAACGNGQQLWGYEHSLQRLQSTACVE